MSLKILKKINPFFLNIDKKKIFLIFLIFGVICTFLIGAFWDIFWHLEIGQRRLKYLFSLGKYHNFENLPLLVKYYPGVYDTISYFFLTLFPKKIIFSIYNLFSFVLGVAGLIGLKKFTKIFFGKNISELVFFLSFVTPIYFGHMIMNPKDIAVSSSFFWSLYYLSKYFVNENNNKKKIAIKLGFFLALGTGSKIVFLGLFAPVVLILLIEYLFYREHKVRIILLVGHFFLSFVTFYFIIVLFWPQTHNNIIILPLKLFIESFSQNDYFGIPLNLYINKIVLSKEVSWDYIPINFIFKTPIYVSFLLILNFFYFKKLKNFFKNEISFFYKKFLYVILLIIVPILITNILQLKIYDGLRNFLFILPLINILICPLIIFFFKNFKEIKNKFFLTINLLIFILSLFIYFSLTPYQYTYTNIINKLIYGPYSFENDYFATSLNSLIKNFSKKKLKNNFKIAGCVHHQVLKHYLHKYNLTKYEIVQITEDFDYAVIINRPQNSNQTCFNYFDNDINVKELVNVSRNGVILSKIVTKKN